MSDLTDLRARLEALEHDLEGMVVCDVLGNPSGHIHATLRAIVDDVARLDDMHQALARPAPDAERPHWSGCLCMQCLPARARHQRGGTP
jgi:hypothetical protein